MHGLETIRKMNNEKVVRELNFLSNEVVEIKKIEERILERVFFLSKSAILLEIDGATCHPDSTFTFMFEAEGMRELEKKTINRVLEVRKTIYQLQDKISILEDELNA